MSEVARKHQQFMQEALVLAEEAGRLGDVPVGCVIVRGDDIVATHNDASNRYIAQTPGLFGEHKCFLHELLMFAGDFRHVTYPDGLPRTVEFCPDRGTEDRPIPEGLRHP